MAINPISKIPTGWAHNITTGRSRRIRAWVATCPQCGDTVRDYGMRSTRKLAKDALYRHIQKDHKPDRVGRD